MMYDIDHGVILSLLPAGPLYDTHVSSRQMLWYSMAGNRILTPCVLASIMSKYSPLLLPLPPDAS